MNSSQHHLAHTVMLESFQSVRRVRESCTPHFAIKGAEAGFSHHRLVHMVVVPFFGFLTFLLSSLVIWFSVAGGHATCCCQPKSDLKPSSL